MMTSILFVLFVIIFAIITRLIAKESDNDFILIVVLIVLIGIALIMSAAIILPTAQGLTTRLYLFITDGKAFELQFTSVYFIIYEDTSWVVNVNESKFTGQLCPDN